uniref:Uncharacterized protein n=1 Tax=Brassica oleracea var. oleracea TaxID=109376 RepID=A0A0D3AAM1_BRAOL
MVQNLPNSDLPACVAMQHEYLISIANNRVSNFHCEQPSLSGTGGQTPKELVGLISARIPSENVISRFWREISDFLVFVGKRDFSILMGKHDFSVLREKCIFSVLAGKIDFLVLVGKRDFSVSAGKSDFSVLAEKVIS